ncbi:MAG: anaerobic ribonucleoside-triphosphate reductase activating protein [Clostridia bacterium]|nr:anaerobic ribonucleoside-triphosphate reductase activating protein [Clostridia bacterium]
MKISGFQKLTLLDYPGKVAALLFTAGCDFRCPFCQNSELVLNPALAPAIDTEYIFDYLKKRSGVLDGVCITGGEPLLSDGVFETARRIKSLGMIVKLDTNGSFPDRLSEMIAEKLCDYVAIDIKSSKRNYHTASGCMIDLSKIEKSVGILMTGSVDYEFRTTCVRELVSRDDLRGIGEWIRGAKRYRLQTFVPGERNISPEGYTAYTPEEMLELRDMMKEYVSDVEVRGI